LVQDVGLVMLRYALDQILERIFSRSVENEIIIRTCFLSDMSISSPATE